MQIHTWATRFSRFKGFRDYSIHSEGELIGQASALWLYIHLNKKKIAKLPEEIAESFPTRPDNCFCEDLDRLKLPQAAERAPQTSVSLRYSDFDPNQHVNSAAYMDFLQTGLYHQ